MFQRELPDGRHQGVLQDELLDELGCLQQGVALAGVLGEILVEVAQQAGVPVRGRKTVEQRTLFVLGLEEVAERLATVAAHRDLPQRVAVLGEEVGAAGQLADLAEDPLEVLPVVVATVGPEVVQIGGLHPQPVLAPAREIRALQQAVVLEIAHEHASQHPGDRHLGQEGLCRLNVVCSD